jgi:hypothetical protein
MSEAIIRPLRLSSTKCTYLSHSSVTGHDTLRSKSVMVKTPLCGIYLERLSSRGRHIGYRVREIAGRDEDVS